VLETSTVQFTTRQLMGTHLLKHDYYLSWSELTSAMEADISFEKVYDQHGLRYMEYIGNRDGSIQQKL